ncbi:MAG: HYR domain-containing protein, partial [Thermoanaerobaculia bacterium]|nr:HYR domain-containing protein [Thermoanaerobaculia bacterium]
KTATLDAGGGYVSYQWLNGPATQTYTVSAAGDYVVEVTDACGRALRDTVQVTVLPVPAPATVTIPFYPGDTVLIGGIAYTQPDTVVQILTTASGCDSVVTSILQLIATEVEVKCPADLTVTLPLNETEMQVFYDPPQFITSCPNPGGYVNYIQGPVSGSLFQKGATTVCFEAVSACGNRDTCCFTITVQQPNQPEQACDVKTPAGCFRFELLGIRFDSLGQRRYRVRLTNTCAAPLLWAAIQLPDGVAAASPEEGATYTAPGGNTYAVRNPNASPFRSIRFKPVSGSLSNGASDIFEYTLPQQSAPAYIHVAAKLTDGSYSAAHQNTFNCPILPYSPGQDADPAAPRDQPNARKTAALAVRPNPTTGQLFVDMQDWQGQPVWLRVLNAQGQLVYENPYIMENAWRGRCSKSCTFRAGAMRDQGCRRGYDLRLFGTPKS